MARIKTMPDIDSTQAQDPAHEEWFRAEVQQAVAEADCPDTEWLSQDDVKSLSQKKRAEWLRNSQAGEKATA